MKKIFIIFAFVFFVANFTNYANAQTDDEVVILYTSSGKIVIELFSDDAPKTVQNFLNLADSGFYDGVLFHRIIKDFMIQGGDPLSKDPESQSMWGTGDAGQNIEAEFNTIKHNRGIVSMARSSHPNSASSQFFIVHGDSNFLDEQYTVFGRIITQESFDTLDKIASLETVDRDVPVDRERAKILSAEVIKRSKISDSLELGNPERIFSSIPEPTTFAESDFEELFLEGTNYYEDKQYQLALSSFLSALDKKPEDIETLKFIGLTLAQQGQYDNALDYFDKILVLEPNHIKALYNKGVIFYYKNESGKAIQFFDQLLELDPNHLDALHEKGVVLLSTGRFEESISYFERVLEINPKDAGAMYNLGVSYAKLGKHTESQILIDAALSENENMVEALNVKAVTLFDENNFHDAEITLKRVLSIEPENIKALQNLAVLLQELEKFEESEKYYEKLIELASDDVIVIHNYAVFLLDVEKYEESISYWDKLLEIEPNNTVALNDKGVALLALGRYEEALEHFNLALQIDPSNQESIENKKLLEDEIKKETSGGGCLIATATYGSELAPQVQMLREIRDNSLLQTQSGQSFMQGFNQFYYSFSPTIADYERQNPVFKEAVKIVITPLVASLSLLNYVDLDSEESVLGYGIGLIILNVGMYFVAPVIVISKLKK